MLAHRIEAIIEQDRKLTLDNLPFHSGKRVEVIILPQPHRTLEENRYPLRGTTVQYVEPTEPADQNDWEVAQ